MNRPALRFFLLFALLPVALVAREDRELRWKPVPGAYGYAVQYRLLPEGSVEEMRVEDPRANLRLPSGRYAMRVAALNKFRKPSVWTDWTEVRLDAVSAVVDLARAQEQKPDAPVANEPGPPPEEPAAPGPPVESEPEQTVAAGIAPAMRLIPGVPQVARGQSLRGAAYWLVFAGLGGAGYSEWSQAERIALALRNDPVILSLLILPTSLEIGLLLREQRLTAEREYRAHQTNQAALGAAAFVLYLVHLVDAFYGGPPAPAETEPSVRLDIFPETTGTLARAPVVRVEFFFRF